MSDLPPVFGGPDAARLLGASVDTVHAWATRHSIGIVVGRRRIFSAADVERLRHLLAIRRQDNRP